MHLYSSSAYACQTAHHQLVPNACWCCVQAADVDGTTSPDDADAASDDSGSDVEDNKTEGGAAGAQQLLAQGHAAGRSVPCDGLLDSVAGGAIDQAGSACQPAGTGMSNMAGRGDYIRAVESPVRLDQLTEDGSQQGGQAGQPEVSNARGATSSRAGSTGGKRARRAVATPEGAKDRVMGTQTTQL